MYRFDVLSVSVSVSSRCWGFCSLHLLNVSTCVWPCNMLTQCSKTLDVKIKTLFMIHTISSHFFKIVYLLSIYLLILEMRNLEICDTLLLY